MLVKPLALAFLPRSSVSFAWGCWLDKLRGAGAEPRFADSRAFHGHCGGDFSFRCGAAKREHLAHDGLDLLVVLLGWRALALGLGLGLAAGKEGAKVRYK